MSRVSFYTRPYGRLEPYDGKLSRTVLRGGAGSNVSLLPDIHSEKDILKLVTALIANTKGEGKAGDDFWVKAETLLYCALIGYIHYEAPVEEQNFSTLIEFINAMEVREDDEEFKNPVDLMFDALESEKPNHFAVRQYKKYKLAAGATSKSILAYEGEKLIRVVLNAAVKPDRQQIFLDELEQIRRDGYAISDNEYDVSASIAKKLKEI